MRGKVVKTNISQVVRDTKDETGSYRPKYDLRELEDGSPCLNFAWRRMTRRRGRSRTR
jgi:hypothetical protein